MAKSQKIEAEARTRQNSRQVHSEHTRWAPSCRVRSRKGHRRRRQTVLEGHISTLRTGEEERSIRGCPCRSPGRSGQQAELQGAGYGRHWDDYEPSCVRDRPGCPYGEHRGQRRQEVEDRAEHAQEIRVAAVSAIGVFVTGVCLSGGAAAQTPVRAVASCDSQDLRGFTIRHARLEDPFWVLRWRKPDAGLQSAVAALNGKPTRSKLSMPSLRYFELESWLPDNHNALVGVQYVGHRPHGLP